MNNQIHVKQMVHGVVSVRSKRYDNILQNHVLAMKLSIILLCAFCLSAAADVTAQRINLNVKNESFKNVLDEIQKQSGYSVLYNVSYMRYANPVTIQIKGKELSEVLPLVFAGQPFNYVVKENVISITPTAQIRKEEAENDQQEPVRGRVTDENGEPLARATIKIKGEKAEFRTDAQGNYELPARYANATLIVEYLGYVTQEIAARQSHSITLNKSESVLDETVVIAYGTTSRRLNTGSVSRVTAEEIQRQPVNNVLGALSGRVPGLEVTQSSGAVGSSFSLRIRGLNSLAQSSDPFILIDGIPFAPQNSNVNISMTAIGQSNDGGGLSPLFSINPADIESIEVLKDADATAIYGSRGANGVILITTRKGKAGSTQITANISQGITRAPEGMPFMNTEQYLAMRREAFSNADIEPTSINAPDLVDWDPDRYTDVRKGLIGNTGQITNTQLSLSGGNEGLQFLLGGGYYRETNVFAGTFPNSRGGMNFNLNHASSDHRFNVVFSGSYNATQNNTTGVDLAYYIALPPNIPSFYDDEGNLNWVDGYENPYSFLHRVYNAKTGNLNSNLNLNYQLTPSLSIRALVGYNKFNSNDTRTLPSVANRDRESAARTAHFGNRQFDSWNVEPQMEYREKVGPGNMNVLIGTTLQQTLTTGSYISLSGFPSDALMESQQAGTIVNTKSSTNIQYRYQALFGRLSYNISDTYLLNLTARRDGSSRFGPGQQYANFGAIGVAWIFTSEDFIKNHITFLSHGKLRGSYGITGNDQIGDYQYLDAWNAKIGPDGIYQGTTTLFPSNLYNPAYAWEENKKLEAALELGFLGDRLLFNMDYFRNRSSNQLVQYRLPYTTGFGSILMNFPALIQNRGLELTLSGDLVKTTNFNWNTSWNITFFRNKLLDFPSVESSSYNSVYVVGEPLNLLYNYRSLGVDPETGTYHLLDVNEDSSLSADDFMVNGSRDPRYYGGFRNNFHFKGVSLELFFDYRKQTGRDYRSWMYLIGIERTPGTMYNQPTAVLDRWQLEGDITEVEKFLPTPHTNRANVWISDALYGDQSFIRLRSAHLSYRFAPKILKEIRAKDLNVYVQGQNLFTWNRQRGYDPEVQNLYALPTLKTYTVGLQLTY